MRNVQEDEIIKIKQQIRYLSLWMNSLDDEALANNSLLQRVLAAGEQIIEDTSDQMEAQHVFLTTDELLENFMDYLDCESLVSTHRVSKRFHRLSAHTVKRKGQSSLNDFQNLRAKEQARGIPSKLPAVPIPKLLLPKQVVVSNCGDASFNGIYYCTGVGSNGHCFTKVDGTELKFGMERRFSGSTLLWYMYKEQRGERAYCFWAPLMTSSDATTEQCTYPSQSSLMQANGNSGWLGLGMLGVVNPPTVEIG